MLYAKHVIHSPGLSRASWGCLTMLCAKHMLRSHGLSRASWGCLNMLCAKNMIHSPCQKVYGLPHAPKLSCRKARGGGAMAWGGEDGIGVAAA